MNILIICTIIIFKKRRKFIKIKKINSLISYHEEIIANPVLEYLSKNNKFKLIVRII